MKRRIASLAAALLMATVMISPASGHEQYATRDLNSSYYTNGVVKSVVATAAHNHCGMYSDIELVIYYDVLNTSKIHITKVKVNYFVKGSSTSGVWGGWLNASGRQTPTTRVDGSTWGDYAHEYRYNSATRDPDGYSRAGSYTHTGPVTVTGRIAWITKLTNVDNSPSCVGGWDYTVAQLRW